MPKWSPPPQGHIKVNTDIETNGVSLGFAARHSNDQILFTDAFFYSGISDPTIAEALGIRQTLLQACTWIREPTLLESNCLGIIQFLHSPTVSDNYVGLVFEDVRHLASKFFSYSFSHIRREANSLAHVFDKHALISHSRKIWIENTSRLLYLLYVLIYLNAFTSV